MASATGLLLEFPDGRPAVTALDEVNAGLAAYGAGTWPLDLAGVSAEIRGLLAQPRLSAAEADRIKVQFLLPRERLLQIIAAAGRTPQVPGGGAMAPREPRLRLSAALPRGGRRRLHPLRPISRQHRR